MAVTGVPTDAELTAQLLQAYTALGGVGNPVVLTLPWVPVAKTRPRFTRGGRAYHDPKDRAAEEKTRTWLLLNTAGRLETNVVVVAGFCRPDRRGVDSDNLLKHFLDASNNVLFYDDVQVTASAAVVEYDPQHPRTVVVFGEHDSSMDRVLAPTSPRRKKPRGG